MPFGGEGLIVVLLDTLRLERLTFPCSGLGGFMTGHGGPESCTSSTEGDTGEAVLVRF